MDTGRPQGMNEGPNRNVDTRTIVALSGAIATLVVVAAVAAADDAFRQLQNKSLADRVMAVQIVKDICEQQAEEGARSLTGPTQALSQP